MAVQLDELDGREHTELITVPGGEDTEPLGPAADGQVVRTRWPLSARLRLSISDAPAPFPVRRLRVEIENAVTDQPVDAGRAEVLRRCLIATHCLLSVRDGVFLSLLDPPAWADAAAKECTNLHTFPVLAGENGGRDVVLSSPIIMYDHPGVAPGEPGRPARRVRDRRDPHAAHDDPDRRGEARGPGHRPEGQGDRGPGRRHARRRCSPGCTAPCARCARCPRASRRRLTRRRRPMRAPRWWDPGADDSLSPGSDAVVVDGVRVARGSRVRLHPRTGGTDAHDMFLQGRTARVEAVLLDVDDERHVAVVLDDDPGADLHEWYGRYHYFAPAELTPLDTEVGRT